MVAREAGELFREYQDHLTQMGVDDLIGDVLTYEFKQPSVTREDLEKWFLDLGLDEGYLPRPIAHHDAFRRATGPDARMRYPMKGNRYGELFVRDVDNDADRIIRYIVREIRDPKGKKLNYDEVGTAVFYKASRTARKKGLGGDSIKFTRNEKAITPEDDEHVSKFLAKMTKDYEFYRVHYYTQAIRDMVRNYVTGLNAISIRSGGGVYFVHKSRRDTVLKLLELVNERIGAGCRIHLMPLLDTPYQREMLTEAFQDEVQESCDKLLVKVAQINDRYRGKNVPPRAFAELQEAYQDTLSRSDEYTKVLGLAQDRAAIALEAAMDSIADVATRIEVAS